MREDKYKYHGIIFSRYFLNVKFSIYFRKFKDHYELILVVNYLNMKIMGRVLGIKKKTEDLKQVKKLQI